MERIDSKQLEENQEKIVVDFAICKQIFDQIDERLGLEETYDKNEIQLNKNNKVYEIIKKKQANPQEEIYYIQIQKENPLTALKIQINWNVITENCQRVMITRDRFGIHSQVEFTQNHSSASIEQIALLYVDQPSEIVEDNRHLKRRKIETNFHPFHFYYGDYRFPSEYIHSREYGGINYYEEEIAPLTEDGSKLYHTNTLSKLEQLLDNENLKQDIITNLTIRYQNVYNHALNYLGNDLLTKFKIQRLLSMTDCPTMKYLDCFCCIPSKQKVLSSNQK